MADQDPDTTATPFLCSLFAAMRPSQWTKNAVVAAAFFFAWFDRTRPTALTSSDILHVALGVGLFALLSSGIYLLNDIHDLAADRLHPVKRFRPLAAGRVQPWQAGLLSVCCLALALGGASLLAARFALVGSAYVGLQLAYTYLLKRVSFVDVLVIAAGFVLRAIAGAVIFADVTISPWLLLCTFLLALFLGLCKRRHEKRILLDAGAQHRSSLEHYDKRLLDQLIAIVCATVIVSYSIYTLWPQTVEKFGTAGMGFTIPFVVFGLFRYLDLVYRKEDGGRPERVLLTDVPLVVNLLLYAVTVVVILSTRA